ncbi:DUF2510 domain-containing protein [Pseudonocardia sp. WMMC193]|uniref:DUF2510 domain-containing protein n=1 Tax=Pseudonocardia sp. WMMC193 TaxID=2911965 RepID=UPI001F1847FD|nr:DUF2510 domain-containing protein [Pseudonocardia sp. WMMC193]MCF7552593.1 DUF2510 domain-containing protein [Pseudonocardia sp. WMMC193]
MTSLSTLGLVDYRSDKERIAKYTRQTRNATRAAVAQNARMLNNQSNHIAQAHVHHVDAYVQRHELAAPPPQGPPPGWYPDPQGVVRWWDSYRWTEHTAPGQIRP